MEEEEQASPSDPKEVYPFTQNPRQTQIGQPKRICRRRSAVDLVLGALGVVSLVVGMKHYIPRLSWTRRETWQVDATKAAHAKDVSVEIEFFSTVERQC